MTVLKSASVQRDPIRVQLNVLYISRAWAPRMIMMTYIAYCTSFGTFRVNARTHKRRGRVGLGGEGERREDEAKDTNADLSERERTLIKQMHFIAEGGENTLVYGSLRPGARQIFY